MILDIYKDAFEYAAQDISTLIKLGVLSFFGFLIIPIFLVLGYQYRIIDIGINGMVDGEDKLPEFNEFTSMFIDGIKVFLVQIIYIIIPIIIFLIFATLSQVTNIQVFDLIGLIIGVIGLIIAVLYSFMAIPNMIKNDGSFSAAFDFERINEVIKMVGILRYIAFVIGLVLITLIIAIVVMTILLFIAGIFGVAIIAVNPLSAPGVVLLSVVVFIAIFSFIVSPYLSIFSGRANGLIYGVGA